MAYTILAIDDHPETLDIIVTTLRSHGYQVVGSRSPVKALTLVEKVNPDLILVDMNMPQMDGLEVCRRIRANERFTAVPIIMFTAEGQPDQKMAGFEAGADDYLTKPTEPDEMILRIETMLESVGKPPISTAEAPATGPAATGPNVPPILDEFDDLFDETPSAPEVTVAFPLHETLIVVLGARGGAGTTTVAINLAATLAGMGHPTTLVDMDLTQGHVAMYLNQHIPNGGLNALAQVRDEPLRQLLPSRIAHYGENLHLLLSRPNLAGSLAMLSTTQLTALLELLVQPGQFVVVDAGHGISETTRLVLDRADHVLVCFPPERVALTAAKSFLAYLKGSLFPHTTLDALLVSMGGSVNLPREAIQSFLGHSLLGVVTLESKLMAQATNKGVPLVQVDPDGTLAAFFRQMANRLATP
ncbi:MAG: response regulator [Anaerolineales bacterium]|nr:response regulator [Anaerolineales bacterium]